MLTINHFAGPGAGKSTTAAAVFVKLKMANRRTELVTEYAKDMTYEGRSNILQDQLYILAKQNRRLLRLVDQGVDYAVTDSPLLLSRIYNQEVGAAKVALNHLAKELFGRYNNFNVFIERSKPYQTYGRSHSYEQACKIDKEIKGMLDRLDIPYLSVHGDELAAAVISKAALEHYEQRH